MDENKYTEAIAIKNKISSTELLVESIKSAKNITIFDGTNDTILYPIELAEIRPHLLKGLDEFLSALKNDFDSL